MAQTSYTDLPAIGQEGQVFDSTAHESISKTADVAIPVAVGVTQGAADGTCKLPAPGDADANGDMHLLGIAMLDQHRDNSAQDYAAGDSVTLIRHGRVLVLVEDAVSAGGTVFVRHTVATTEQIGDFRSDADGTNADPVLGAKFVTSAGAGELAVIELDLVGV